MMHSLAGAQLLAALTIKFNISWWRFGIAMAVLAGMIYAGAMMQMRKK
jgi:hypothetical protein